VKGRLRLDLVQMKLHKKSPNGLILPIQGQFSTLTGTKNVCRCWFFCDVCSCEEFKLQKYKMILKSLANFSSETIYLFKKYPMWQSVVLLPEQLGPKVA